MSWKSLQSPPPRSPETVLKVFRLVNHRLRHLSNIERRGRGGKYSERYTNFENLQSVADVLSGIVAFVVAHARFASLNVLLSRCFAFPVCLSPYL